MKAELSEAIEQLVQEAPAPWLEAVCAGLQSWPPDSPAENMLQRLPSTHNGDLAYRLREVIRLGAGAISWEALGSAISLCSSLYGRWQAEQKVELLWAGPAPAGGTAARRIDRKRLTNTPVRQAGSVLKCPDDNVGNCQALFRAHCGFFLRLQCWLCSKM